MIGLPDAEQLELSDDVWERACMAAQERRVDDEDLLTAQRMLAQAGRWDGVYVLSVMAGLETSVLIDADEKIFIDWGTRSSHPNLRAGFCSNSGLHPRFASYWSILTPPA